ncbi:MAG: hypothetical protein EA403_05865 [Spirochaetaceae bacterium]|nr:MAG: hypothetical protein EA403_05865 [Spirochaetaceae bacterium]
MNTVQKIALSLLLAVLVFSGFAIAAFSGLFSYIETTFYDPRVRDSVERTLDRAADAVEMYHRTVFDRFSAALGESAVRNVYRVNQSREDIVWRDAYFGELRERMPAFSFVRFVDLEGERLWFSTLPSDLLRQDATTRVFRPVQELDTDLSGLILQPGGVEQDRVLDPQQNLFIYRFLVRDGFDIPRGTALFSVTPAGLRNALIRADVVGSTDVLRLVPGGMVLNATAASVDQIAESFGSVWPEILEHQAVSPEGDPDGVARRLVFTRQVGSDRIALLVPESEFQMNLPMRVVLLVSSFLTTFLVAFLLLNLRQDATLVLSERVKRFQINFLREYMESKEELDWDRWSRELESRREDVRSELKRGVGGLKKAKAQEVDELFDKSWDEILSLIGSRRQITRGGEGIDLDRLESIIEKMVSNLASTPTSSVAVSSSAPMRPESRGTEQPDANVPERDAVPTRELIDVEDVEPGDEDLEDIEDLDEVEELGEADEAGEAEELGEAVDVEEVEELSEADDSEELEELTELDEVGDIDTSDERDSAPESRVGEGIVSDEALDADEEIEEAEPIDTVESLIDEPSGDVDDLEAAEDEEPLSSLSADADDETLDEVSASADREELEEAAEREEADETDAEFLGELDAESGVEEIETFEALEAVDDDADAGSATDTFAESRTRKAPDFGIVETDGVLEASLEDELADTRRRDSIELYEGELSGPYAGGNLTDDDEDAREVFDSDVEELEITDVDFSGLQPVDGVPDDPSVNSRVTDKHSREPVPDVLSTPAEHDEEIESHDVRDGHASPEDQAAGSAGDPLWNELKTIREDWESPSGVDSAPRGASVRDGETVEEGIDPDAEPFEAELLELESAEFEPESVVEPSDVGANAAQARIVSADEAAEELPAADEDGGEAESMEALENIYGGFTFGLFGFGTGEAIPSRPVAPRDLEEETGAELEELAEELELLDDDEFIDEGRPGGVDAVGESGEEGELQELEDLDGADGLDESAELEELEAEDELEELDELEEFDEIDEPEPLEPGEASSASKGAVPGSEAADHGARVRSTGAQRPVRSLPPESIDRDAIRVALGSEDESFETIGLEPLLAFLKEHGAAGTVLVEQEPAAEEATAENTADSSTDSDGAADGEAYGIDDILSMGGGLDLLPMGPIGERIESRLDLGIEPDVGPEDTKRLNFGERGLDYDRFLSRFKRNEGGLFKSLIEFTRIWNAKFSAILVEKEGEIQVDYLLGLEDPCFNYLRIPQHSAVYQHVFGPRRLLILQKTLQNYSTFRINCSDVEFEYVGATVFVPIRFRDADAYMMLGLGEVTPSLDTFFDTLVVRQASFA